MNKHIYCIYHSRDLDGFTSGALIKKAFTDNQVEVVMIPFDYGQPSPIDRIEKDHKIIMADVSLPMEDMRKLANHCGDLVWIDHHVSAITDFYKAFKPGSNHKITEVLDDKVSACEGVFRWLYPSSQMPLAIELLGKYDTWRESQTQYWKDVIMPFQYGMRLICSSPETFPIGILNDSSFVKHVTATGNDILRYQDNVNQMNARGAFEMEWKGYNLICINGALHNSQAFASVYDEKKHDIMMPFKFVGDKWVFSLYTTKEIDCSELAKSMGGGGHMKAAGFQLEKLSDFFPAL